MEGGSFPSLRLVANFGVGYDRIGVDALAARGVAVTNTPGVLDAATADLTWALILAARRRVVEGDRRVRAGEWTGVVGGRLPRRGAHRLDARHRRARPHRAVPSRGARKDSSYACCRFARSRRSAADALDELLAESDIVTIHAPLTPETRGLLDARRLWRCCTTARASSTPRAARSSTRRLSSRARLGPHPRRPRRLRARAARPRGAAVPAERRAHTAPRQRDTADARGDDAHRRRQRARARPRRGAAYAGSFWLTGSRARCAGRRSGRRRRERRAAGPARRPLGELVPVRRAQRLGDLRIGVRA